MDFLIYTYDGSVIGIDGGPELSEFAKQLNNPSLLMLSLGGELLSKDLFKIITPKGDLEGGYELHTKDGGMFLADIPEFNPDELAVLMNNPNTGTFVLVGNILVQRTNIKRIKPVIIDPPASTE